MEDDAGAHAAIYPVLDRLVKAGWAVGWMRSDEAGIHIQWNEELDEGRGGENRFLDFVELLMQLCGEKPLSESDQAMLVVLEQMSLDARD
jgi:DNA-binding PadR family transcriptional regulator